MKKMILLLATTAICFIMYAQTNTQPGCYPFPKTISATGSASMEVIPDEIYVQVDLREYKKKGEDKVGLDRIRSDFLGYCKATGIADNDISVASYDGYNMANIWQRRKKDPELLSSISYQIKFSDTKMMDDLVKRLDDQATNNFRITRTSHSKIVEYEQLGQAIEINEPVESISSDVVSNAYRDNYKSLGLNEVRLDQSKNAYYGITDQGVDYRKIKLRFEVKVLYALK
jgi:uncharacterized protein